MNLERKTPLTGCGPYHRLYASTTALWEGHVGKLVTMLIQTLAPTSGGHATALDLGAGEGDNAIYMAQQGYCVDLIEISPAAFATYERRVGGFPFEVQARLSAYCADVRLEFPRPPYDLVVCYGLLHCFDTRAEAAVIAERCVRAIKPGGHLVVSCLINEAESDHMAHPELRHVYRPTTEVLSGWFSTLDRSISEIEAFEERHGDGPLHSHEVFRAIYQAPAQERGGHKS